MNTWINNLLLLILCMTLAACSAEAGLRDEFEMNMKAYNRMLRWHEIEKAGMAYIEKDQRDVFMKKAEDIKKRGVTVADYRILTTECLPEKKSAEVVAEFDYFILPSNRIKTITYRQEWIYTDLIKSWKLKSGLPDFD